MKEVILLFPSASTLLDFASTYRIEDAEIFCDEASLKAILFEDQIGVACKVYKADVFMSSVIV